MRTLSTLGVPDVAGAGKLAGRNVSTTGVCSTSTSARAEPATTGRRNVVGESARTASVTIAAPMTPATRAITSLLAMLETAEMCVYPWARFAMEGASASAVGNSVSWAVSTFWAPTLGSSPASKERRSSSKPIAAAKPAQPAASCGAKHTPKQRLKSALPRPSGPTPIPRRSRTFCLPCVEPPLRIARRESAGLAWWRVVGDQWASTVP